MRSFGYSICLNASYNLPTPQPHSKATLLSLSLLHTTPQSCKSTELSWNWRCPLVVVRDLSPCLLLSPLSSELLFLQESLLGVHMYWYISFRPTCLCSSVCSSVSIVFLLGSSPHCALHSPQILPTICNQSWSQELMSFMCLGSG